MNIFAQNYELIIQAKDSSNTTILASIPYEKQHLSKESVLLEIDTISNKLSKFGYINYQYKTSTIDSVFNCVFTLHKKIELVRIYYTENTIEKEFLKEISLTVTDRYFEIPLTEVEDALNSIIEHFENLGHSFSNISLSNLVQKETILTAELNLSISNKRTIDNVVIKGYPEFPKKYLKHYLKIKPNTPFNLNSIEDLYNLTNTIPFVSQIKKPEVLFTKDSTTLFLYLKKKSNSNFDGIIGFSNEDSNGKIKFNGYLDLELNNILNKGESFRINWENSQRKNSSLKLAFGSPYIFNTKLNLDGSFSIFKQDSLFINTNGIVKLGYNINHNNTINIKGATEKSNLSSSSNTIYDVDNYKKNMFGVSYVFRILEKPIYINRYKFLVDAGYLTGTRKSENLKTQQNSIDFFIEYTSHLNTRNSIFIKSQTKLLNTTTLFENELFRIGGINSIRGFDENSIRTPKFIVTNIEYHYRVNTNSYLYTITDVAILENINTETTTQLYGLGLGYYLSTKNTILNLSYAVGKNYKTSFDLNNSKVHIKITYPF